MSLVFVVDQQRTPLDPVHPGRARYLLTSGHAAVVRRYPFTIILKESQPDAVPAPLRVKIDPGSKTTGIAVENDATGQVAWAAEIQHRGQQVKQHLEDRRAHRRSRRTRHTRYRPRRFENRCRPDGWLPPSLESRIANVLTWVRRLCRWAPVAALSQELVKFDMQLMERPEISGAEYQQGTLAGYEVREYLLEKFQRTCAYCGKRDVPLEIEHMVPKSRGGTNRVSNLTLACEPCNRKKGNQTAAEFGHPDMQAKAKAPLKDAAVVNASRWALYHRLQATGLPIETGSGGRTKWNRTQRAMPKTHWLDAACVGQSTPKSVIWQATRPLLITATGHHNRQMCLVDRYGFPRTTAKGPSQAFGFCSGDMVKAVVARGKPQGTHVGKVAIKTSGAFTVAGIPDISYRFCRMLQRKDGYAYRKGEAAIPLTA